MLAPKEAFSLSFLALVRSLQESWCYSNGMDGTQDYSKDLHCG